MAQTPMPSLPIERGQAGPALLAHILVGKYCDHLPLYRQSGIYAREGVELDRATISARVSFATFGPRPDALFVSPRRRCIPTGAHSSLDDQTLPTALPRHFFGVPYILIW